MCDLCWPLAGHNHRALNEPGSFSKFQVNASMRASLKKTQNAEPCTAFFREHGMGSAGHRAQALKVWPRTLSDERFEPSIPRSGRVLTSMVKVLVRRKQASEEVARQIAQTPRVDSDRKGLTRNVKAS